MHVLVLMLTAIVARLAFVGMYTDVDYHVFNDAAAFIAKGESPYNRDTYRYTPLLAWLLQPNVFWNPLFGKLFFVLFDVWTGYLIYSILQKRGVSESQSKVCAALWLLNPLPISVSSRGNAESLMTFLVLCVLKFILDRQWFTAGLLYGLSVHVKIYPVTYALPIYLLLGKRIRINDGKNLSWKSELRKMLPNRERISFISAAVATLGTFTGVYYYWYGWDFIYHTYLYHVTRRDTRHNFSVYFYMLYQLSGGSNSVLLGLLTFLPQAFLLLVFSFKFYVDPAMAFFLNTFAFVALNKVCTSQYFLWYLGLLPLLVPQLQMTRAVAASAIAVWFVGQALWLFPAYLLEFQGINSFLFIWVAGLLFFCANIYVMITLIRNYKLSSWLHQKPPKPEKPLETKAQKKGKQRRKYYMSS